MNINRSRTDVFADTWGWKERQQRASSTDGMPLAGRYRCLFRWQLHLHPPAERRHWWARHAHSEGTGWRSQYHPSRQTGPSGCSSGLSAALCGFSVMALVISVFTTVGLMEFTRMPFGPNSSVITRVRWSSAAFEAQYTAAGRVRIANWEDMLMMTPPSPRVTMPRATTWDTLMTAFRFTFMVTSISDWVISRNGVRLAIPALFTRQCTGPRASTAARVASQSVRSQATVSTEGHSAFRVSRWAWVRDRAMAWPPQAATRSTRARPIPRPAPVIRTRLPDSEMFISADSGSDRYRLTHTNKPHSVTPVDLLWLSSDLITESWIQ